MGGKAPLRWGVLACRVGQRLSGGATPMWPVRSPQLCRPMVSGWAEGREVRPGHARKPQGGPLPHGTLPKAVPA